MSYMVGSLFSGGGLADWGLREAGFIPAWGVEIDNGIADAYEANLGPHIIRKSVLEVDPRTLPPVDLLWASPPCIMYSQARSKLLPSEGSEDLGLACIPFLRALRPRAFVLENVTPYRDSGPFLAIVAALHDLGYFVDWGHINSADFGVPQTRTRLILRAIQGSMLPPLAYPEPWVGWYQAIADLIPSLPPARFAQWQMKRLRVQPIYATAGMPGGTPAFVIDCTTGARMDTEGNRMLTIREAHEPLFTLVGQSNRTTIRAMVEIGKDGRGGYVVDMTTRALARFMSLPDAYILPEKRAVACKVLGQGVACLVAQRIGEQIVEVFRHLDA